ncbi:Uncharacterised protein [Mycobacteroides abscessus subsp. abscessus]|uniref:Uncharacterized protein n=1 Tax=Mycobacteroides abscessus subsp. abscessus TaxID=1185650 RepID=A0AB38D198_9MYCO|nr:Uncharacterised protein [Mycobacteroides abscessus subsp. abscessus]SIB20748.1 Uncharacterised protein [Mycobacteroides abscessus subsp. abscessus]SIB23988.1 Uncharacterised protein [Mycobacteroides abscessus subsp. abscessus]SKR08479.1 Uncharacterised protein [Mycobacteroides abscessus subsp. abscessus]SKT63696.1 Uncharacterised protein [Mycobacteroides abscessus subsp. abscessus]
MTNVKKFSRNRIFASLISLNYLVLLSVFQHFREYVPFEEKGIFLLLTLGLTAIPSAVASILLWNKDTRSEGNDGGSGVEGKSKN